MTIFEDKILLFEDIDENYETVSSNLLHTLTSDLDLIRPDLDRRFGGRNGREAIEVFMEEEGPPLLTILDWDLTAGTGPITRDNIVTYTENNHLPLCIYHQRDTGLDDAKKIRDYDEDRIKLDPELSWPDIGIYSAHIADGFNEIYERLEDVFDEDDRRPIPEILDAPIDVRGKLDQYSWGNPGVIKSGQEDISEEEILRRATTNQGYWIRNELLEFPGALLNEVALAAYLNVDHMHFSEDDSYKEPFSDARYTGPFSEMEDWWWTPLIEDIRIQHMTDEDSQPLLGPELFHELDLPEIEEANCHSELANGCEDARYYCLIKELPVCKIHSVQPEGWIPKGSTRSRVSEEDYDQLKPWIMM